MFANFNIPIFVVFSLILFGWFAPYQTRNIQSHNIQPHLGHEKISLGKIGLEKGQSQILRKGKDPFTRPDYTEKEHTTCDLYNSIEDMYYADKSFVSYLSNYWIMRMIDDKQKCMINADEFDEYYKNTFKLAYHETNGNYYDYVNSNGSPNFCNSPFCAGEYHELRYLKNAPHSYVEVDICEYQSLCRIVKHNSEPLRKGWYIDGDMVYHPEDLSIQQQVARITSERFFWWDSTCKMDHYMTNCHDNETIKKCIAQNLVSRNYNKPDTVIFANFREKLEHIYIPKTITRLVFSRGALIDMKFIPKHIKYLYLGKHQPLNGPLPPYLKTLGIFSRSPDCNINFIQSNVSYLMSPHFFEETSYYHCYVNLFIPKTLKRIVIVGDIYRNTHAFIGAIFSHKIYCDESYGIPHCEMIYERK